MDEAYSRLSSVLSVCDHELHALEALADQRTVEITGRLRAFQRELAAFLESFEPKLTTEDGED